MTGHTNDVKGEAKGQEEEEKEEELLNACIERKPIEGDCLICFDPLQGSNGQQELTYCRLAAGCH